VAELTRLCVFCGSSTGTNETIVDTTVDLGRLLVEQGIDLVYGGGAVGLMGLVADTVLAAGGRVTGVIPKGLFAREVGHTGLTELIEVASMHERKALMYELSDGFCALPGGLGTLEELAEITTWGQLGLHTKPIGLLNVDGFYDPLLAFLDRAVGDGLLKPRNRELVVDAPTPEGLLAALRRYRVAAEPKWIGLDET
jgi:uncharacterized protein (TIGR00730 family)